MKPYKINLFRLGLLLPTYLIFSVVYSITYDSGGLAFIILWPAFFASYAAIVLGNIFIFRDISKLKASFEDNELIQKTSTIQLVLAAIGFFMQILGFRGAPLNYIDNFPLLVSACIVYSIILLIGIYQTIKLGQGKDFSAIPGFIFGIMVIFLTSLVLFTTASTSSSPSITYSTPSFAKEFQSVGLKGKVELTNKHREIEMFNGTVYNLTYTENLSDGTILKKYTDAKIHEDGEHLSNFFIFPDVDLEALLNEKEKALFHTVKQDEFSFLLYVNQERPNLQQEEDSIKNATADKINKLFDTPGEIASSFKFGKYPIENYYVAMIKLAISNREKGDFDAAGFYNITTKDLMKNKVLTLDFDFDLSKIKVENGSPLDTLKEKFLSLPKNSFSDGIYNIYCYYENGIQKKVEVICPFVVEDGVGHFEEDEIVGNQTN